MICSIAHFKIPKYRNKPCEYEDFVASSPSRGKNKHCSSIIASIADGASDSIFSSEWAKILTTSFIDNPSTNRKDLEALVNEGTHLWNKLVARENLPWYVEEKARYGAFSTFLGMELYTKVAGQGIKGLWRAIAIGDSCFFQIRDRSLKRVFPIEGSESFGVTPHLISSRSKYNTQAWQNSQNTWGTWDEGDIFILATDALSMWLLQEVECDKSPWNKVLDFNPEKHSSELDAFNKLVQNLRVSLSIRNDDVTCSIIEINKM